MSMKAGKIKTQWIILVSLWYTFIACFSAVIMRLLGKINRKWVDKTINTWINHLLETAQVNTQIINPDHIHPPKGRAVIIMCNHSSSYDIPLSYKAFPSCSMRMLAKREMAKIPIMGKGMEAAEFPFIDRKNRYQAIKDLQHAKQLMESGIILWIAPEGTRSKNGKLGAFKKGGFITAIEAQAIIIPIGIRGAFSISPPKSREFNLNQTATLHIGKPIDAADYNLENKDILIERVHQAIRTLTGEAD